MTDLNLGNVIQQLTEERDVAQWERDALREALTKAEHAISGVIEEMVTAKNKRNAMGAELERLAARVLELEDQLDESKTTSDALTGFIRQLIPTPTSPPAPHPLPTAIWGPDGTAPRPGTPGTAPQDHATARTAPDRQPDTHPTPDTTTQPDSATPTEDTP